MTLNWQEEFDNEDLLVYTAASPSEDDSGSHYWRLVQENKNGVAMWTEQHDAELVLDGEPKCYFDSLDNAMQFVEYKNQQLIINFLI